MRYLFPIPFVLVACSHSDAPTTTQQSQPVEPIAASVQVEANTPPGELVVTPEMADAMAKELGEGLQEAFQEQMRVQALGGTPEQIAQDRARYDRVEVASEEAFQTSWQVPADLPTSTAAAMLRGLVEGCGLDCNFEGVSPQVEQAIDLDVHGMSRVQAIETIAQAVGISPNYPETTPWEESTPQMTFQKGPRTQPVTFAGPFVVEVRALTEAPPYTIGTLRMAAHALGLPDAVLTVNDSMREWVRVETVEGSQGQSFDARPDVQRLSQPRRAGELFTLEWEVELTGLLQSVEAISLVAGQLSLQLPEEVFERSLDGTGPASQDVGAWTVRRKNWSADCELEISGPGAENVAVAWAPETLDGTPLGIVNQSLFRFGKQAQARLTTSEPPARVGVKILATRAVEWPFAINQLALHRFAEQPEAPTALEFDHAQPVSVVFVDFEDRANDFPTVRLRSVNHCNKDTKSVQVKLIYLDDQNKTIGDCFTSLDAPPSSDPAPTAFLAEGDMQTTVQNAFFMPKETVSVQVSVAAVDFLDGTRWEAQD
ncbi:MAG TPA: hypothetical protein PLJ12_07620 [Planctomycetota bacterium]|nr:hypothetical protein [Planctomycetota bacterium]